MFVTDVCKVRLPQVEQDFTATIHRLQKACFINRATKIVNYIEKKMIKYLLNYALRLRVTLQE